MYRVAILGCENSHANSFLKHAQNHPDQYGDIVFVGAYSDDREAAEKLHIEFGIPVADRYDQFVGEVDGLVITARHGDDHYKFAKPYLTDGIPMFIDKPISISEEEAVEFMQEAEAHHVQLCGGSVVVHAPYIKYLKLLAERKTYGKTLGGFLRAPVDLVNPYGNFHFYCQHLVQAMAEIFGYDPKSVCAYRNGDVITCVIRYETYDVTIVYANKNYVYYAGLTSEKKQIGSEFNVSAGFPEEFDAFVKLLKGGEGENYDQFIRPVFIQNAIERSLRFGHEEIIQYTR